MDTEVAYVPWTAAEVQVQNRFPLALPLWVSYPSHLVLARGTLPVHADTLTESPFQGGAAAACGPVPPEGSPAASG